LREKAPFFHNHLIEGSSVPQIHFPILASFRLVIRGRPKTNKRRRSVALQPVPWRGQLRLDLRCVGCIFPPCNSRKAAEPIKRRRSVALQPVPWRTFGNLDPLYRPRTIASSQQVGAISSQCSRINMTVASMPPIHPAVALRLDLPLAGRPRDFPETRS